ncbi:MAG TPA: PBP1A family penicillin-binding protein [Hyphomonadaceae bacterium]|nr:PBP1A family penicillin-binding protein [Hyphomonadaceae bacterium]
MRIDGRFIKWALIGTAGGIAILFLGVMVWFFAITQDLPSEEQLANYEPPIMSRVHAGDGKLVAEFATQHRVYVPSDELPDTLIQAFVSAEDKTFFEHSGIDFWGMFRGTVLNAIQGKRMEGGSTITQQVVKNMLVGSERSISRKVREAVLAMRIEKKLSKEEILELYMNEIYLGGRSYGVGAAALNYFGKSLGDLTVAECAMLASLPKAPGKVNPYENPKAAVERRNWVIERMVANGYIDKATGEKAKAEELKTVDRLDSDENQAAAYYVEELRRQILKLGKDGKLTGFTNEQEAQKAFLEGGLSIRSTLDSNIQLIAQTTLRAGLETYDRYHSLWRGPLGSIPVTDQFETALNDFANSKDGKEKIAGAGNTWQIAMVKSVDKTGAKIGLSSGTMATIGADDVKYASGFKRPDKSSGLKPGDVIFVSHEAQPDLTKDLITDYGVNKKLAPTAPWHLRQIPAVQGAIVAMDPHTGRVLAMSGGYSFERSQYNRAMQAMRQPGSSFKPFVYATALEQKDDQGHYKWTPASRVLDAPYISCAVPDQQECYRPANYENDFYGLQTLRFGVEHSRNTMTLRLAGDVGMPKISEMGERMGIYDKLPPYEAMALGAGETTPIRMITAYAALVNGGKQVHPVMFDRIQNRYGQTVFRTDNRPCDGCMKVEWKNGLQPPALPDERKQLLDPVTAYQVVSILQGVVEHPGATGGELLKVGKPIAAKTGTTNNQVDAWMMGFTPDLVLGVWVGFDQPRDMGFGATGGRIAAPIFRDFMIAALKDRPGLPFRVPKGAEQTEIDLITGCLPGPATHYPIIETFQPGTAPTEQCEGDRKAYTIDLTKISAGDEAPSRTSRPEIGAQPADGQSLASAQPGDPNLPPQQQTQPQKPDELTIKDGNVF